MHDKSDAQLLREYADHGDQAAFREIVTRHTDVLYSSALRQVGSPDLARDVAQSVFTDLARKAPSLARTLDANASLLGWLYRSTRFAALNQLREDRRRQNREKQAMQHLESAPETTPEWEHLRPILDEAMLGLGDEDREALLLRFFKHHDFRSIGRSLGVSDDAAQKRVSRALEKLREHLTRRGVTATVTALATSISANAVTAAPTGLAATLSTGALAGTTIAATITATSTATATKAIAMTTLQKTIIGATLTAVVGTGIYEAHKASNLREQLDALRQQQAALVSQLETEKFDAAAQLAAMRDESERLKDGANELLTLRAEVSRLRARQKELTTLGASSRLPASNSAPDDASADDAELPKDSWADVGFGSPQDALRTRGWSVLNGDRERFAESVHITDGARKILEDMFVRMAEASTDPNKTQYIQELLHKGYGVDEGFLMPMMAENQSKGYSGYRILSQQSPSAEERLLEVETGFASAPARTETFTFRRFGDDWKVVIDEEFLKSMAGQ